VQETEIEEGEPGEDVHGKGERGRTMDYGRPHVVAEEKKG
jgi:hypothetical protein